MTWSGLKSASSRRILLAVGVAVLLSAGSNLSAQQAADDPLKLNFDVPVMLVFQVKPDRIADFEALWPALRAGLANAKNEELKAIAPTLDPYKVQGFEGLYVLHLQHPSKTHSYNPVYLLYYAEKDLFKREDADAIHKKWEGAPAGFNKWPLGKIGG